MVQKSLGRGLEALISTTKIAAERIIPLDKIHPNRYQPREDFDTAKIHELSESIKAKGLLQPLVVSTLPNQEYELIAGERRYRAAKLAGLKEVPVIIREVSNIDRLQISLIENIQREDLNPIEEAKAYRKILTEFNITQEQLSKTLSKDRSVIANTLRLLTLPDDIQQMVANGTISSTAARALVSIDDKVLQRDLAKRILQQRLTVRDIEKIVTERKKIPKKKPSPEVISLQEDLQQLLGTKVQVKIRGKKGKIEIFFYSLDDLDRLLKMLYKSKSEFCQK